MKILISGYYGFDNAGDELILRSIVSEIRSRNPEAGITVLSAHPKLTEKSHGIPAIQRHDPFKVLKAMRACDVFISGGGGLFQDDTGNKSLYYYLFLILLARLFRKKVFIYAAGANSLRKFNRAIAAGILRLANTITVRENYSRELLVEWGCPFDKIEVSADPVLNNDVQQKKLHENHPKVAFILRPPRKGVWQADTFSKLADSVSHRLSARVVFIPFHPSHDLAFTLKVMNGMSATARLAQWDHAEDLYDIYHDLDFVISQRLHGLILAAVYGIPLVGISEDPKIERFLRELGQQHILSPNNANPHSLIAAISDVWEWREEFRKNLSTLMPPMKLRSQKTAEALFSTIKQ